MQKTARIFLCSIWLLSLSACQSKPPEQPLSQLSDAELADRYQNSPVKAAGGTEGVPLSDKLFDAYMYLAFGDLFRHGNSEKPAPRELTEEELKLQK